MTLEFYQVELTDQELERVMGGSGGAPDGINASAGVSSEPSAGVQASGTASGTISIGTGIGIAKGFEVSSPSGIDVQVASAHGVAVGVGVN